MICDLASEGGDDDEGGSSGGTSNILAMVYALAIVVAIVAILGLCYLRSARLKAFVEKVGVWKTEHRAKIDLMYAQVTVVVVTIQTAMLMANNHEAAGGKKLPSIYANFLGFFKVANLDFMGLHPAVSCMTLTLIHTPTGAQPRLRRLLARRPVHEPVPGVLQQRALPNHRSFCVRGRVRHHVAAEAALQTAQAARAAHPLRCGCSLRPRRCG